MMEIGKTPAENKRREVQRNEEEVKNAGYRITIWRPKYRPRAATRDLNRI